MCTFLHARTHAAHRFTPDDYKELMERAWHADSAQRPFAAELADSFSDMLPPALRQYKAMLRKRNERMDDYDVYSAAPNGELRTTSGGGFVSSSSNSPDTQRRGKGGKDVAQFSGTLDLIGAASAPAAQQARYELYVLGERDYKTKVLAQANASQERTRRVQRERRRIVEGGVQVVGKRRSAQVPARSVAAHKAVAEPVAAVGSVNAAESELASAASSHSE